MSCHCLQCALMSQDTADDTSAATNSPEVLVTVLWRNSTTCTDLAAAEALPGHIVAVSAHWRCAEVEIARQPMQLLLQLTRHPICRDGLGPQLPSQLQLVGVMVDPMQAFAQLDLRLYRGPGSVEAAQARSRQRTRHSRQGSDVTGLGDDSSDAEYTGSTSSAGVAILPAQHSNGSPSPALPGHSAPGAPMAPSQPSAGAQDVACFPTNWSGCLLPEALLASPARAECLEKSLPDAGSMGGLNRHQWGRVYTGWRLGRSTLLTGCSATQQAIAAVVRWLRQLQQGSSAGGEPAGASVWPNSTAASIAGRQLLSTTYSCGCSDACPDGTHQSDTPSCDGCCDSGWGTCNRFLDSNMWQSVCTGKPVSPVHYSRCHGPIGAS